MASVGPAPPPSPQHKRKRGGDSHESNPSPSSRQSGLPGVDEYKKRRVLGPSLPPAPLDQMPAASPNKTPAAPQDESSSDESDFGPAPGPPVESSGTGPIFPHRVDQTEEHERVSSKPQREEWMLAPPTHGDWTSRVDPTKLRNRKFNTGKGARAPNQSRSADNRLWTETPEQKRQRLEDEVLGKKKVAQTDDRPPNPSRNEAEDRETERRIREYNETNRGSSLYREHKKKTDTQEDDPSRRAFDREKDIGGSNINFSKRREMVNKASDFGSRFAKGSYL